MTQVSNTEINGAYVNVLNGQVRLDFVNRENGYQIWSRTFTGDANDLCEANRIADQDERIMAIYQCVSIQVDNYISEWEFENE